MKYSLSSIITVVVLGIVNLPEVVMTQDEKNMTKPEDTTKCQKNNIGGEYYEVQPTATFTPEICVPDSLSNFKLPVKVWVNVEVDSLGIPISYQIIKSSNNRFNELAGQYALKYQFNIAGSSLNPKYRHISIPISFKKINESGSRKPE